MISINTRIYTQMYNIRTYKCNKNSLFSSYKEASITIAHSVAFITQALRARNSSFPQRKGVLI